MASLLDYLRLLVPRREAQWSIGVYAGPDPLALAPHPGLGAEAALRASGLPGISAAGVADPFMVRHEGRWFMFFEVENRASGRGEIGLASSADAIGWRFEGIVLREAFHLSYPFVFEHAGSHYMVPESAAAGAVRLYRATSFPTGWELAGELVRGSLVDPTLFRYEGRWWMMALEGYGSANAMVIFHAEHLTGPWRPHARNPITTDLHRARPAGRPIQRNGQLIRFAQDDLPRYGRAVRAFAIDRLTLDEYGESPLTPGDLLGPAGTAWNATGMHHIDAHALDDGTWIACVDGCRARVRWPLAERLRMRWAARAQPSAAGSRA